jgi:hypothetical protein
MKRFLIALITLSLILPLSAGCKKDNGASQSLESILQAVKERIAADLRDQGYTDEDFADDPLPGFMIGEIDPEELGIGGNLIDSSFVIRPGFGISPDEIIVIKAESGKASDVRQALEARNSEREAFYRDYDPAGADRIANATLKVKGDYVICIIFDNAEAFEALIDQLF